MNQLLARIDQPANAPSLFLNSLLAVGLACLAALVTQVMISTTGTAMPFLLNLGVVIAVAWLGGAVPGIIATALMLIFGAWNASGLEMQPLRNLVALTLFSIVLSFAGELLLRARTRASQQQDRLEQREQILQSMFETMPAAMTVIDGDGSVLAINKSALAMFGLDPTVRLDGRRLSLSTLINLPKQAGTRSLCFGDQLLEAAHRPTMVTGKGADGARLAITIAAAVLRSQFPRLMTVYLRDETPARRAAEAIAEAQSSLAQLGRAAALGAMGSAIAHELNQPLASATNFAGAARAVLLRQPDPSKHVLSAVEAAIEQIVRAGEILKGLRMFVRAAPAAPRWLKLSNLVDEAAQLGHFVLNDVRASLENPSRRRYRVRMGGSRPDSAGAGEPIEQCRRSGRRS